MIYTLQQHIGWDKVEGAFSQTSQEVVHVLLCKSSWCPVNPTTTFCLTGSAVLPVKLQPCDTSLPRELSASSGPWNQLWHYLALRRAPEFFISSHEQAGNININRHTAAKQALLRLQGPSCWRPVQNKAGGEAHNYWNFEWKIKPNPPGGTRCQHPPATHLSPAHSPSPHSGMGSALLQHKRHTAHPHKDLAHSHKMWD